MTIEKTTNSRSAIVDGRDILDARPIITEESRSSMGEDDPGPDGPDPHCPDGAAPNCLEDTQ